MPLPPDSIGLAALVTDRHAVNMIAEAACIMLLEKAFSSSSSTPTT